MFQQTPFGSDDLMPVKWTQIYQSILMNKKGYKPIDLWDITMSDYLTILQPLEDEGIDTTVLNEVIEFDRLSITEKVKRLSEDNGE